MEFKKFTELLKNNIQKLTKDQTVFTVDVDPNELYQHYLNSFPDGKNELHVERTSHDCSVCKNFIRKFGGVVVVKNNKIKSVWNMTVQDDTYSVVAKSMTDFVESKNIAGVFLCSESKLGVESNKQLTDSGVVNWHHFNCPTPTKSLLGRHESQGEKAGVFASQRTVLENSLLKISQESVNTVIELIEQNSVYRGREWLSALNTFNSIINRFNKVSELNKDAFLWVQSINAGPVITRIKNTSIGTLLTDISDGMCLDAALKRYEKVVAPHNYKRPKAVYSKDQIKRAKDTLEELGLINSLKRRFAVIDDISVNNILFADRDVKSKMTDFDPFDELQSEIPLNPKNFGTIEEVSSEFFINNILPTAKSIQVMMDNKIQSNLFSLIAPDDPDSESLFKWNNGFSWAYNGNIADSSIRDNVKEMGGNINGVMRFSISWNENNDNNDDLDAHCRIPNGETLYYANDRALYRTASLDVDITNPNRQRPNKPSVENIVFTSKERMPNGDYEFLVNNYSARGASSGFNAEVEIDGEIYQYSYNKPLKQSEKVKVATVSNVNGKLTIKHHLDSSTESKTVWGVQTNQLHPVTFVMNSPNYWDDQKGIGNQHLMFVLDKCVNEGTPNGFFNEYLKSELNEHKRVFEALGSKMKVTASDEQLSGVGFSLSKRGEVVVEVTGQTKRLLKVKF